MTPLSIQPEDEEGTAYGKTVSELQSEIAISDDGVTGTLHHITDYLQFSNDPTEQEGYYLAIKVEAPEDATVKFELTNGKKGEFILPPEDRQVVCKISNKDTQEIRVTAEKAGCANNTLSYSLSGLTLDPGD